jgi:iron complex transport system substrate-binding protein
MEGLSNVIRRSTVGVVLLAFIAALATLSASHQAASPGPRPSRIISLIPAVTEMLFAIGAGPQVLAVSSFDEYPPEVKGLQRVGALLDPNLERILALKPDLVIVYGSQEDLIAQLTRAGLPIYNYRHAGLADVTTTISNLGDRIGRSAEAGTLVQKITTRMADIRRRVAGRRRPRTMLVFGREQGTLRGIYASGGRGFLHDMLEAAGGENVFADITRESVQATTELILTRKPEMILEVRAGPLDPSIVARETAVWDSLSSLPAVRTHRIEMIVDPRIVIPGPRVAEGTELLARALHPDAFK